MNTTEIHKRIIYMMSHPFLKGNNCPLLLLVPSGKIQIQSPDMMHREKRTENEILIGLKGNRRLAD